MPPADVPQPPSKRILELARALWRGEVTVIGRRRYQELMNRLAEIDARVGSLAADHERSREAVSERLDLLQDILRLVYEREPEMRERVGQLREDPLYQRAFEEPEPLVSVVMSTYDRHELLLERAIPSVLAQTYENFEIIVVGDAEPPGTADLLAAIGDPRIRYENLTVRGPYPSDPRDFWHVLGVPPRNAAVARARGLWIAPLDDDDAFLPHHIERLLETALRERREVAYGLMTCVMNDGSQFPLGAFPPRAGQFGWQAAIFHAGLRFFEAELAGSLFYAPADWSLCRRMLRAGVRFIMLDELVTDHYESQFSPSEAELSS